MSKGDRPLSPHLGIHRWHLTMAMSIVHRMTGVVLGAGAILFVAWLVSVAQGPAAFAVITGWLQGPFGVLLLLGWTFSFFYHLANGIRHMFWDVGRGFELHQTTTSGLVVIAFSVLMTTGFWFSIFTGSGA